MELTSQAINEAEFSMSKRGYDPDQVDDFLEKLAVAVDKQNEALAEARERAAMAERRAAEAERRLADRPERPLAAAAAAPQPAPQPVVPPVPSGPSPAEVSAAAEAELETLKRTLVLAQKTADATVREAEDEARRMIATAERDAEAAEAQTRARIREEIAMLDAGRAALQDDVAALERFLDEQRQRLRTTVGDLQRVLDDPGRLQPAPRPSVADVHVPPAADPALAPPPARSLPSASTSAFAESGAATSPGDDDAGVTAGPNANGIDDATDAGTDDDAWARFGTADVADDDPLDLGPPTQPVLRLDDLAAPPAAASGSDDAYLDELRKAMIDDTGAPPFADETDEERGSRSRFGRRR